MRSKRKEMEQRAGAVGFSIAERTFIRMSPDRAEWAGSRLGGLFFRAVKSRRQRMLSNLQLALPELSEDRRLEIAFGCARHFGVIFADFLRSSRRTDEEILATCPLVNRPILDEALSLGKGVLLITGHFGNWERAAHAVVAGGYRLTVVARDANDTGMNRAVMRIREKQGVEVLSRGNAARGILKKLSKNEIVAILPDQNSTDIYVPFFGKPCGTVVGPATLHVRTGAPLVPLYCPRLGPNTYEARLFPALKPVEPYDPVEGFTRAINDSLEQIIRQYPDQWLWFHDRWKSARKAGLI